MDDLISRQAAINAADSTDYTGLTIEDVKKVTDEVVKALKQLPSVQPIAERHGQWCVTPDGKLVCSNCYKNPTNRIIINASLVYDMTPIKEKMRYCPNCGAHMEGAEDDPEERTEA